MLSEVRDGREGEKKRGTEAAGSNRLRVRAPEQPFFEQICSSHLFRVAGRGEKAEEGKESWREKDGEMAGQFLRWRVLDAFPFSDRIMCTY